jgi:cell wall-associated NlpC family hydrolase
MFSIAFTALLLGGCATTRPTAPQRDRPVVAVPPAAVSESAAELAFMALSLLGTPYAYGGSSPDTGFDCSGLVAYVYARALEARVPRRTSDLARAGVAVDGGDLQAGDLVFYNTLGWPFSHVGIYLGERRFVHAPSTGGAVRVADMRLDYWQRRFDGARRIAF